MMNKVFPENIHFIGCWSCFCLYFSFIRKLFIRIKVLKKKTHKKYVLKKRRNREEKVQSSKVNLMKAYTAKNQDKSLEIDFLSVCTMYVHNKKKRNSTLVIINPLEIVNIFLFHLFFIIRSSSTCSYSSRKSTTSQKKTKIQFHNNKQWQKNAIITNFMIKFC